MDSLSAVARRNNRLSDVPCMTDADHCADIRENCLQHLVAPHLSATTQTIKAVVRQNASDTHSGCTDDGFTRHTAQTSMSMNEVNPFSNQYIPQERHESKELRQGCVHRMRRDSMNGDVVDLEIGS